MKIPIFFKNVFFTAFRKKKLILINNFKNIALFILLIS
jgi:hypothetical protein